jgi:hypothetical protein
MSYGDRDTLKPGDLVQIKYHEGIGHPLGFELDGVFGLIVSSMWPAAPGCFEVMVGGGIHRFYAHQLELVQAAPGMIQ